MSKQSKEFEKKMAIKKAMNEMNRQITKLEESEKFFYNVANKAKANGLTQQLNLAISGLKSTISQKKKVQEMLLNFQIMTQTKDMLLTTSEFLKGMGSLSKDMVKLCDDKQFATISLQFEKAMNATEKQTDKIDYFMKESQDSFSTLSNTSSDTISEEEIMSLLENNEETSDHNEIEEELNSLKKKIEE